MLAVYFAYYNFLPESQFNPMHSGNGIRNDFIVLASGAIALASQLKGRKAHLGTAYP